jgi:hypothetical protein
MALYLHSREEYRTHLEYRVLSYNKETKRGTVIGSLNVPFETDLSVETLRRYGWYVDREPYSNPPTEIKNRHCQE